MITLHLNQGNSHEGVYLRLPATLGEIGVAFGLLEKLGVGEVHIFQVACSVSNLGKYIQSADPNSDTDLNKMNSLAERINRMDDRDRKIFAGALDAESINGLDDVLRLTEQLDDYILLPNINSDAELGRILVDTGYKNFSEAVQPYLNYAAIGAEYHAENGGAFGPGGYVRRKSSLDRTLEHRSALITLHLLTQSIAEPYRLELPATDEELNQAKAQIGVSHFAEATITKAEFGKPHLDDLIPQVCICVEDANELALGIEEMMQRDGEFLKFLAVLSVEQPKTMTDALHFAMELNDYEGVVDDAYEYGRTVLLRCQAVEDVLEAIEGYMDFDKFGDEAIAFDGVRQTEFGCVRRISVPFPREPQMQQLM